MASHSSVLLGCDNWFCDCLDCKPPWLWLHSSSLGEFPVTASPTSHHEIPRLHRSASPPALCWCPDSSLPEGQLSCADGRLVQFISTGKKPKGEGLRLERESSLQVSYQPSSTGCRAFPLQGLLCSQKCSWDDSPDDLGLVPQVYIPSHYMGQTQGTFLWKAMTNTSIPFCVCPVIWVHSTSLGLELGYADLSQEKGGWCLHCHEVVAERSTWKL